MKTYKIAVLPGDGTGPEVIAEGLKVLNAVKNKVGIQFDFHHYDFGGNRFLATGEVLPDGAIEESDETDNEVTGTLIVGGEGGEQAQRPIEAKEVAAEGEFLEAAAVSPPR